MLAACCLHAQAGAVEESSEPGFSLSGFGTVGAVHHDEAGIRYRRDLGQGSGVEEGQFSFKPDSMLGVQLDARLGHDVEAAVQVVSRLTTDDDYAPELTMAYLKFRPTAEVSVRAGRLILESYMQGDAAEIGYANLTIRQPLIYYPRGFDGMDAETVHPLGDGMLRLKGAAGWMHGKLVFGGEGYDMHGSSVVGGAVEYAWKGWTGRYYTSRGVLDDELSALRPGGTLSTLLALAPNGAQIRDKISQKDRAIVMHSLGLAYDSGPLRGMASYSTMSSDHWPTRHQFYANLGYRFGQVTPYIAYASQRASRDVIDSGIPSGVGLDAVARALSAVQGGMMPNQTDFTLGVRYDFSQRMALKVQADHIRYRDAESVIDTAQMTTPVEERGWNSFNLLSVALDFVF
jgi:hypothetical protein